MCNPGERARRETEAEGTDFATVEIERLVDLRYHGQGYELTVPLRAGAVTADAIADATGRFHALHQTLYGNSGPGKPLEMMSVRLRTASPLVKLVLPEIERAEPGSLPVPWGSRPVYFEESGGRVDTAIYHRATLKAGHEIHGPAIIDQPDSTTVLLTGQTARVDAHANIIIKAL